VNVQFKVFFRLNTIRLCASLERAVDSRGFLPLDRFPPAAQVTYNYYIGRLAIFDEDYVRRPAAHCPWLPVACRSSSTA